MPGKPLLSLTTKDIPGATPTPLEKFTNRPPKDEVPGSKPKLNVLTWNRPVMNLDTKDITGDYDRSHFLVNCTRASDPLNPTYPMPSFKYSTTPEPKFLRSTLDWSDLEGSRPRDFYAKKPRDIISCTDIQGSTSGTTPRSYMQKNYWKRRPATSLDVQDISGGKFISTRHTNPLEPEYVMRCESSLGYMGRGAMEYAKRTKSSFQQRPSLETTNSEKQSPDSGSTPATEQMLQSVAKEGSTLVTVGPVDRSKPGWRPRYANKYYEDGERKKDASLRSDDCPGTELLPNHAFWTMSGGVWKKTSRPRRGFRNQIPADDIDGGIHGRGAKPILKKDTMYRSLGRQSDPADPVYIPLDGVAKAGLLEREILSKTVKARQAIQKSGSIAPDQNAAKQLAESQRLNDSLLASTFKSADLRKTGKVSYPTFVQGLNALGVAMPARDAVEIAKQLDPSGTGEVNYSALPSILHDAYQKRSKFEADETARRLAAVEDEPQIRTMAVPPMMKLKDKLYQKNEKLYKSFGLFDIDKIGSVTTQQFADTVDRLNIGVSKETANDLAKQVDFQKNGIITYFEFSSKMDYADDFARKEDKIGPPKTPTSPHVPSEGRPVPPKAASLPKTSDSNAKAGLGDTAMSIDLGVPNAEAPQQASRQQSRIGSRAGSGRVTPMMNMRTLDAKTAYQKLELERAVENYEAELNNVAALPDGTPRRM